MPPKRRAGPDYVIEHLEDGLEKWCSLEYRHICQMLPPERVVFLRAKDVDASALVPEGSAIPRTLESGLDAFKDASADDGSQANPLPSWDRVCLLDMDAELALEPDDCSKFDALVFGGILGNIIENPDGTYGSDDRTSIIRALGFTHRRHLGAMQMTTDTAVLVSRMVIEEARPLAEIPFIDCPEFSEGKFVDNDTQSGEAYESKFGATDSTCMEGFRYVAKRNKEGKWEPILPEGMVELLCEAADDNLLDELT